jgi:peptide-methionine (S)-S-oxide reductase
MWTRRAAATTEAEMIARSTTLTVLAASLLLACLGAPACAQDEPPAATAVPPVGATATATFAGGCFWCMVPPFEKLDGVLKVTSGYTGGIKPQPTYEEVSSGDTGHAESIEVIYDPHKITYDKLLDVFWHNVDPTTPNAQFCDHGNQYRTAIFYHGDEQKRLAEKSKQDLQASGKLKQPIVTEIVAAKQFWPAEDYHQDYYKKNPIRYHYYRYQCGRDQRLEQLWGPAK